MRDWRLKDMELVDVFLTNHARLDCLTLRYGKLIKESNATFRGQLDDVKTQDQKPKEIKRGNQHYVGTLNHSFSGTEIKNIRLVLAKPDYYTQARAVVSVLMTDGPLADRAVTDLIRDMRQQGEITPEFIVTSLHPLYVEGKISSAVDFYKQLVELGIRNKIDSLEEDMRAAEARAIAAETKLEDRDEKIKGLIARIHELETSSTGYAGEPIETAPICTLKSVTQGTRTTRAGKVVQCTFFSFEESVPTRTMDSWCDPDGTKAELAKSLIGHRVITSTWKPDIFPPLRWCRSIYEAP